jgi:hypothetical protein
MTLGALSKRLQELERVVEQLQQRVDGLADPDRRWWIEDAGRFANDPIFDEIVRLGRQHRKTRRPRNATSRDRS